MPRNKTMLYVCALHCFEFYNYLIYTHTHTQCKCKLTEMEITSYNSSNNNSMTSMYLVFSGVPCSHTINFSPPEGWGKEEGEEGISRIKWDSIFNSLCTSRNKSSSKAKCYQWNSEKRGTLLLRLQFPILQCRGRWWTDFNVFSTS